MYKGRFMVYGSHEGHMKILGGVQMKVSRSIPIKFSTDSHYSFITFFCSFDRVTVKYHLENQQTLNQQDYNDFKYNIRSG